jgi:hypothetical protein
MKLKLSEGGLGATGILRAPLLQFLFLDPLDEQLLKFFLRVNVAMNQQSIHRIDSRLKRFISGSQFHSSFVCHKLLPPNFILIPERNFTFLAEH